MRHYLFALAGILTLTNTAHVDASSIDGNKVTQGFYHVYNDKGRERIEVVSTDSAGHETGRMSGDVTRDTRLARFTALFGENCLLGFTPAKMKVLVVEDISGGTAVCEIMPLPTALRAK
ncbi:hypothetical protein F3J44_00300 [Pantoea sp. Tr-811]|uniref:hypothetical protein n=1 Tax=Pantoea sp. Tr-811 TaxID=2608361 RepID=UPI001423EEEB|nr:hypothetical protein [Pantoea sp. Tr-811]NIF24810.1 hypothetical protein [Pantoea sp. Tr-811]